MRVKKFFCGMLAAAMILFASVTCSAADDSANAKLAKIEFDTYGSEQTGALLDRISRLEKDFNGQNMSGNMNARIEAIWNNLYNNFSEPGILAKINVLEWNANHEVRSGGIDTRITMLEREILGKTTEGTFNTRIRELARGSYGQEILPIAQVQIPANTLIKVETTAPASSKVLQEGDIIPVRVVEDVFVDGNLVFVKGLPGEGRVMRVLRAKNIFSNGKIETDFHTLKTIDGQDAQTFVGIEALEAMNANSMARGLSLVGQTFSGKNKDIEEVFVRGKNIDLPAGITLYVQIKTPIIVYGLKENVGNIKPVENVGNVGNANNVENSNNVENVNNVDNGNGETVGKLSDDEMITPAPPQQSTPPNESEPLIERVDKDPPPPANKPNVESLPNQGKTPEGSDGEIIEIIDED